MEHICCILIMITAELTKVSLLNVLEISAVKLAKFKSQEKISCNFQEQAAESRI